MGKLKVDIILLKQLKFYVIQFLVDIFINKQCAMTNHKVSYFLDNKTFYKVNHNLERITKLENNEVIYLDYHKYIDKIRERAKKIQMNEWKSAENNFFISRDFEWSFNGEKYKTNNKKIEWTANKNGCGRDAVVFHNGKIWVANDYYYPRIALTLVGKEMPRMSENLEPKLWFEKFQEFQRNNTKWTDVKYLKSFEKI